MSYALFKICSKNAQNFMFFQNFEKNKKIFEKKFRRASSTKNYLSFGTKIIRLSSGVNELCHRTRKCDWLTDWHNWLILAPYRQSKLAKRSFARSARKACFASDKTKAEISKFRPRFARRAHISCWLSDTIRKNDAKLTKEMWNTWNTADNWTAEEKKWIKVIWQSIINN